MPYILPTTGSPFYYERHQGRSRSRLLRAFDNKGDPRERDFASLKAHSSAFPQGKQKRDKITDPIFQ